MANILGFDNYSINEQGEVYSEFVQRVIKPSICNGYLMFTLINNEGNKETVYLHRIFARAFIENPENKPFINHKDGNRANFALSNLEWVTALENNIDSLIRNKTDNTKVCKKCGLIFFSAKQVFCSKECTKLELPILTYSKDFILWAVSNYPMNYLATLNNCSDTTLRKRLKSEGINFQPRRHSIYEKVSLEDMLEIWGTSTMV